MVLKNTLKEQIKHQRTLSCENDQVAQVLHRIIDENCIVFYHSPRAALVLLQKWMSILSRCTSEKICIIVRKSHINSNSVIRRCKTINSEKINILDDEHISERRYGTDEVSENFYNVNMLDNKSYSMLNPIEVENKDRVVLIEAETVPDALKKLSCTKIAGPVCVILYEVGELNSVEDLLEFPSLKDAQFKTVITSSPREFINYYESVDEKSLRPFIHKNSKSSFYKHLFGKSEIIYYSKFGTNSNDCVVRERIESMDCDQILKNKLLFLLENDVFSATLLKKYCVLPVSYVSEKISYLYNVLIELKGTTGIVYCTEYNVMMALFSVVSDWVSSAGALRDIAEFKYFLNTSSTDLKNAHVERSGDGNRLVSNEKAYAVKGKLHKNPECTVDVRFVLDLPKTNEVKNGVKIVLFNYNPAIYNCQCYLFAKSEQKEEFKEMIKDSEYIDQVIRPALEESGGEKDEDVAIENATQSHKMRGDDGITLYKYRVYIDSEQSARDVRAACRTKKWVHDVQDAPNGFDVLAMCRLGIIFTAMNLNGLGKQPVLLPRRVSSLDINGRVTGLLERDSAGCIVLRCMRMECCNIVRPNTATNMHPMSGTGCIIFRPRGINVYVKYKEYSMRVEINYDDIESHVSIFAQDDMNERSVKLALPLRRFPKVFITTSSIQTRLLDLSPLERLEVFETLDWNRASLHDFPFFEGRNDIILRIPAPVRESADIRPTLTTLVSIITEELYHHVSRVIYTNIYLENLIMSPADILQFFETAPFDDYFAMASLLSRKGRMLVNKISRRCLADIKSPKLFAAVLDDYVHVRFRPIDLDRILSIVRASEYSEDANTVRTATITPMNIVFGKDVFVESNRVLRHFDRDKFLRAEIRDDDGEKMWGETSHDQERVYDYFRRVMKSGISVGRRKYFFLGMTTSQLKSHSAWYITPYQDNGRLIGADYIKTWLGEFASIKNIGKYVARIGQAFSTTRDACEISKHIEIPDVERNGYNFTDGVGMIPPSTALEIVRALKLPCTPSAFQIRYGGYKGVVVVHQFLESREDPQAIESEQSLETRKRQKPWKVLPSGEVQGCPLILRPSMKKFTSGHNSLEIVTHSKATPFFLNRQIIIILSGLGIENSVFIALHDQHVSSIFEEFSTLLPHFVKKYIPVLEKDVISMDYAFIRRLIIPVLSRALDDVTAKAKIAVPKGRCMIGVVDELQVLGPDEVFFMCSASQNECLNGCNSYGAYFVPTGSAIVVKNPCMHPGDIRVVRCVDKRELHYLKDVLVFSQLGDRPVFNQCSGSDLDGDVYLISWDKTLIPKCCFKPYVYTDSTALVKTNVLLSDMVNFYLKFIKTNYLGVIANAHLAAADKETVFGEKALKLSELFNRNIDFVKTGNFSRLPDDLVPEAYPDYMRKSSSYESKSILGVLYRRLQLETICTGCECSECVLRELNSFVPEHQQILRFCGVVMRESGGATRRCPDLEYLMDKYGTKSEADLFLNENAVPEMKMLISHGISCSEWQKCDSSGFSSPSCLNRMEVKKTMWLDNGIDEIFAPLSTKEAPLDCTGDFIAEMMQLIDSAQKESNLAAFLNKIVSAERVQIFKEILVMLLISGVCTLNEPERLEMLLREINSRAKDPTKMSIARALFSYEDNIFFRIGVLLLFDISLVYKARSLCPKSTSRTESKKQIRRCKSTDMIIQGMLDENEDIEFVKKDDYYVPVLRNPGKCELNYYRDTVRNFVVGIVFSDSLGRMRDSRLILRLKFIPGNFKVIDVEPSLRTDSLSVKEFDKLINTGSPSVSVEFLNHHVCMNPVKRVEFFKRVKVMEKRPEEVEIGVSVSGTVYKLWYRGGELYRITKGSDVMIGRQYLISCEGEDRDLKIEFERSVVVYDDETNILGENAMFLKDLRYESTSTGISFEYSGGVESVVKKVIFSNSSGFTILHEISHRQSGESVEYVPSSSNLRCFISVSWYMTGIDCSAVDKIFSRLWKTYLTHL